MKVLQHARAHTHRVSAARASHPRGCVASAVRCGPWMTAAGCAAHVLLHRRARLLSSKRRGCSGDAARRRSASRGTACAVICAAWGRRPAGLGVSATWLRCVTRQPGRAARAIPCTAQKRGEAATLATHRVSVPGERLRVPVVVRARRRRCRRIVERRRRSAALLRVARAAARQVQLHDASMQGPHRNPTAAPGPGATVGACSGAGLEAGPHSNCRHAARCCGPREARRALLPHWRRPRGRNRQGKQARMFPLYRLRRLSTRVAKA